MRHFGCKTADQRQFHERPHFIQPIKIKPNKKSTFFQKHKYHPHRLSLPLGSINPYTSPFLSRPHPLHGHLNNHTTTSPHIPRHHPLIYKSSISPPVTHWVTQKTAQKHLLQPTHGSVHIDTKIQASSDSSPFSTPPCLKKPKT